MTARSRARWRIKFYHAFALVLPLIQNLDRITRPDHAFHQHCAIDPGKAFMITRDLAQNLWVRLGGVGVERDHLATRVAIKDGDHRPGTDLQSAADETILGEANPRPKVGIECSLGIAACRSRYPVPARADAPSAA